MLCAIIDNTGIQGTTDTPGCNGANADPSYIALNSDGGLKIYQNDVEILDIAKGFSEEEICVEVRVFIANHINYKILYE